MSRKPLLPISPPEDGTPRYLSTAPRVPAHRTLRPRMSDSNFTSSFEVQRQSREPSEHRLTHSGSRDSLRSSTVRLEPISTGNSHRSQSRDLSRPHTHTSSNRGSGSRKLRLAIGQQDFSIENRIAGAQNASFLEPVDDVASSSSSCSSSSAAPSPTKGPGDMENESVLSIGDDHSSMDGPADNSPYAMVRASVAATDDTSLSINTPRMWFLSMLFAILGSSTNLFFSLRYPSVSITPVIALLLVHPLGLLWDQLLKRHDDPEEFFLNGDRQHGMPDRPSSPTSNDVMEAQQPTGKWGQLRRYLAQGRWNEKEHACVYISSNVSFGFAFATDVRLC